MYTCWHATKIVPFLDFKARYADFLLVLAMLVFIITEVTCVRSLCVFIRIFYTFLCH